ncbi:MAG: cbb3-type cytochrome c oxidase subunit II [Gammaproteobacteria bacterium]|nr:cbb3-type cytochrome c oxidase subunit II [Gammaproteobacteria bacterium]
MAFREYKIGARMFGIAFGTSMFITLYMPAVDIANVSVTATGLHRQLSFGRMGGFGYEDPLLTGVNKPVSVVLKSDPKSGQPIEATNAYVYDAGVPFPNGLTHPRILGKGPSELSNTKGKIGEANNATGAVFIVREVEQNGEMVPYIENATATRGWMPSATLAKVSEADRFHVGKGKIMFVREGCWWCHTLLPEETQDWQYFGAPPMLGDFNGENPTAFGSDRKAPDLTHVGSRNSSREWMTLHFFNPRLVQPHSIMPRYDYLWGDVDANGRKINFSEWYDSYDQYAAGKRIYPPEVPEPAKDSEARALIDFVLNLK